MTAYERLMQLGSVSMAAPGTDGGIVTDTDSGMVSSGTGSENQTVAVTEASVDFLVTVTVSVVRVSS